MTTTFDLRDATARDLDAIRELFREYVAGLGVDLAFQGFEDELATLPGKYAPPGGALLIARTDDGAAAGCVALRPHAPGICEMKRLYVRDAWRGHGLGERLARAILERAHALGYRAMRLDTLDTLTAAVKVYERLGFRHIDAYYDNPLPGVIYWERALP